MNIKDNHVDSIARLFQLKGKRTGLVTTTRVTHASPAGMKTVCVHYVTFMTTTLFFSGIYAHTADRHWETDTSVIRSGMDPTECHDIARQLVFGQTGRELNVIMGGGRKNFLPQEVNDEEGHPGLRFDHINLIEEWKRQKEAMGVKYQYVWNRDQLLNVSDDTDYLLGEYLI